MKNLILYLLAALVAGSLLFGWGYRHGAASVKIRTEVRIDTVFYEKPRPVSFSDRLVVANIPRMLYVPADTVVQVVAVGTDTDSVQIEANMRTLEYHDSTYYARVVGPVVGTLAPRLDWIETYNRTITKTSTKSNRFAVTAGVGVGYTSQGIQPYVGVSAGVILWKF